MKDDLMEGKTKRKHSRAENLSISPAKKDDGSKQNNCEEKPIAAFRPKQEKDRLMLDPNVDRKVFVHEEDLANTEDPAADLTEFRKTCRNISNVVSEINAMKLEEMEGEEHVGIIDKRINAMLLTTNLKKLNRLTQIRGKKARENTLDVKAKVDGMHLALQNLHYEILRMKKEIEKCMNFSSKDEEIDLVSLDKFYLDAPEEITKPGITKHDPHKQMLARLAWEMKTRKELALKKTGCLEGKKKIQLEIDEKSEYLVNLKPRLDQIIKSSLPVQEFMGMPIEADRLIFEKAQFLPHALYVLYVQAKAYKDACDKEMAVDIGGDIVDVKSNFLSDDIKADFSDESDTEQNNDTIEDDQKRGRKSKMDKKELRIIEQQKRLFQSHPLTVTIKISHANQYDLNMKFSYISALRITAVDVSIELDEELKIFSCNSLLEPTVMLKDLLSVDSGKESPNPTNAYQLKRHGITDFLSYMSPIGIPYYWVQWLCGMNYLPGKENQCLVPNTTLSVTHFQSVIQTITLRLESRLALVKQLQLLQQLVIPPTKSKVLSEILPPKIVSTLTCWNFIPFEDCMSFAPFKELLDEGMVSENSITYSAKIARELSITVLIVIHQNYPERAPLMLLSMEDEANVNKQSKLFCLEREVNAYAEELFQLDDKNLILSNMLRKLQISFDMFVETGEQHETKDQLYTRRNCGRDRNRPYKYHKDGYFIHR